MNESPKNFVEQKSHSKLGIASIIIGFAIIAMGVLWYLISFVFFEQMFGPPMHSVTRVVRFTSVSIVLAIIFAMLHLVGIAFGIAGWASKKTYNLFPIIGTFFNLLLVIGDIILIVWWGFIFFIATAPVH
jgi:hypothetical protein